MSSVVAKEMLFEIDMTWHQSFEQITWHVIYCDSEIRPNSSKFNGRIHRVGQQIVY